jgi:hypothetical protein
VRLVRSPTVGTRETVFPHPVHKFQSHKRQCECPTIDDNVVSIEDKNEVVDVDRFTGTSSRVLP